MIHLNPEFDNLPTLRVPSYQNPKYDGDMALLHELRDRIFCYPREHVARLAVRSMWFQTHDVLGYYPDEVSFDV